MVNYHTVGVFAYFPLTIKDIFSLSTLMVMPQCTTVSKTFVVCNIAYFAADIYVH